MIEPSKISFAYRDKLMGELFIVFLFLGCLKSLLAIELHTKIGPGAERRVWIFRHWVTKGAENI